MSDAPEIPPLPACSCEMCSLRRDLEAARRREVAALQAYDIERARFLQAIRERDEARAALEEITRQRNDHAADVRWVAPLAEDLRKERDLAMRERDEARAALAEERQRANVIAAALDLARFERDVFRDAGAKAHRARDRRRALKVWRAAFAAAWRRYRQEHGNAFLADWEVRDLLEEASGYRWKEHP